VAPEGGEADDERQVVGIGGAQGRVAEHELRLLPVGLVDELDAPAVRRHGRAQLERVGRRRRDVAHALEGAREAGAEVGRVDVARGGDHQVPPDEVALEVRGGLAGRHGLDRGGQPLGRVAVRVIAEHVAREESSAERAVIRPQLLDLRLELALRARELGGREGRAQEHVGDEREVGVEVPGEHVALEARLVGLRLDLERRAERVEGGVELLARLAARAPQRHLGREVGEPLAVPRILRRARARRDDQVHERHRAVALDDDERAARPLGARHAGRGGRALRARAPGAHLESSQSDGDEDTSRSHDLPALARAITTDRAPPEK